MENRDGSTGERLIEGKENWTKGLRRRDERAEESAKSKTKENVPKQKSVPGV